MKAFVQVDEDGEFNNQNAYLAWRAFNHYGFEVIKFAHSHIWKLPVTHETPCFGGVNTTKAIFKKLKLDYSELPSYPESLYRYLRREIHKTNIGELRKLVCSGRKIFAKPLDDHRKMFHGKVFKSEIDLVCLGGVPDEWPIFASDVILHEIKSEYRVFILDDFVLDARKYLGDYEYAPSSNAINNMIRSFRASGEAPKAYCLDVAVAISGNGEPYTLLIEVTDAWAFGHYGLDMVHYGKMLIERWNEMCKF